MIIVMIFVVKNLKILKKSIIWIIFIILVLLILFIFMSILLTRNVGEYGFVDKDTHTHTDRVSFNA